MYPNGDVTPDGRVNQRTNLFLGAVLQGFGFSVPVNVRNMSSTGAMVEGAAVPPAGSAACLTRGPLMVPAEVVWSETGRCGLRFASLVSVREWLAAPANVEQKRVDEVVRLVKAGAIPLPVGSEAAPAISSQQLGFDLRTACRLIEAYCEDMGTEDPMPPSAQNLDIALQTIAAVADLIAAECDDRAAARRLENLRSSSRQALEKSCWGARAA